MRIKLRNSLIPQKNTEALCIWEDLDNLTHFVHPRYKTRFRFMSMQQVLDLASEFNEKIKESGLKKVLSIDSGSRPFVRLMKKSMNQNLAWKSVKVSRIFPSNVSNYILFYLTEKEKNAKLSAKQKQELKELGIKLGLGLSVENLIRLIANKFDTRDYRKEKVTIEQVISLLQKKKSIYFRIFNIILRNTRFSRFLEKEFILFDEYVTSGTTLFSTHLFLSLFNINLKYKLITYYFNSGEKSKPNFLFYSKYYKTDLPECYHAGIYPFENRIDVIGSFYYATEDSIEFRKNSSLLSSPTASKKDALVFLESLNTIATKNKLAEKINQKIKYKDVQYYNNNRHITRYLLYLLEKDPVIKDFYDQYFEMYAPIWSPLPLDYHINFVKAYKLNNKMFLDLIKNNNLNKKYQRVRRQLLNMIVKNANKRRLK